MYSMIWRFKKRRFLSFGAIVEVATIQVDSLPDAVA